MYQSGSRSRSPPRSRSRREIGIRTHHGASTTRVDHPTPESRAALEREFAELNRQHFNLMKEKRKIKKRIQKRVNKLEDKIDRIWDGLQGFKRTAILPTAVIHFVHLLEKANLYFQFKTSAKRRHNFEHSNSPISVSCILLRDDQLMSEFNNIDDSDIHMAANAIYWEPLCKLTRRHLREPALSDWIYKLVYRALQADYVMDQDPEVELKKMMNSKPDVYDSYFLFKRLPTKYKMMSKQEAYRKYSELVSIIICRSKEALEEKRKSTSFSARESEAFDRNHKVTSTAVSARNKQAVNEKHKVPSIVTGAGDKGAFHYEHTLTSTSTNAIDTTYMMTGTIVEVPPDRKREEALEGLR